MPIGDCRMNTPDATKAFERYVMNELGRRKLAGQPVDGWAVFRAGLGLYFEGKKPNSELPPSKPAPKAATPEAIYAAYPRHVGKAAALRAIERVIKKLKGETADPVGLLLAYTNSYAEAVAKWPAREQQYIPHPATWFNQGRYLDDPKEWVRGNEPTKAQASNYKQF